MGKGGRGGLLQANGDPSSAGMRSNISTLFSGSASGMPGTHRGVCVVVGGLSWGAWAWVKGLGPVRRVAAALGFWGERHGKGDVSKPRAGQQQLSFPGIAAESSLHSPSQ